MSWLGQGFSRESMQSMADAFAEVIDGPTTDNKKVEVVDDSYSVSVEDGIALEEGKKKCKDGYEWDSDEGKCVKKKKSSKTTIIIGRGYGGHHHDDDDNDNGNDGGDTGGGDAGGGDGGGGGGE